MSVTSKRLKMKRTQISLLPDEYEMAKQLAEKRGVSLSQVFRDALHGEADAEQFHHDPLRGLIGIIDGDDPHASENIDEVVYGEDIR